MNPALPRRSLSRLAGICGALLLTACGAPAASSSAPAESAAQPSGVTVNILCTVNNAGDPLTVNRVSSQSSEDHYTYAYLPLEAVLYREAS